MVKKTYIQPSISIIVMNSQLPLAGSVFGTSSDGEVNFSTSSDAGDASGAYVKEDNNSGSWIDW